MISLPGKARTCSVPRLLPIIGCVTGCSSNARRGTGTISERGNLSLRDRARQRREAAIGAGDDAFRVDMGHGGAQSFGDLLRRFHLIGRDIDGADEDFLVL